MKILLKFLKRLKIKINRILFWSGSKNYWENRYHAGGNSGNGSYGQLAIFKAEIINDYIRKKGINSVIEWGCGDGNQLSLAEYPCYIGVDVSETAIEICKDKYRFDKTKTFLCNHGEKIEISCDLALSLDVIYHLVEDDIYDNYMINLFSSSTKYVCIYSCNYDSDMDTHVKCRKFSDWIEKNQTDWRLDKIVKNKYPYDKYDKSNTSWSDFYFYTKIKATM